MVEQTEDLKELRKTLWGICCGCVNELVALQPAVYLLQIGLQGGPPPYTKEEVETFKNPKATENMSQDEERQFRIRLERYRHIRNIGRSFRQMGRRHEQTRAAGAWRSPTPTPPSNTRSRKQKGKTAAMDTATGAESWQQHFPQIGTASPKQSGPSSLPTSAPSGSSAPPANLESGSSTDPTSGHPSALTPVATTAPPSGPTSAPPPQITLINQQ
ncbi:uncharacterized protein LOC144822841 [Lissotriton helveticus]